MINTEAEYNQMLSDNNEYQHDNQREMTEVDAYCRECDAYICDERVTFEECCDVCGTDVEYR